MSPMEWVGEGEESKCLNRGTGDGGTEGVRGGCASLHKSTQTDGKGQAERKGCYPLEENQYGII